MPNWRPQPFPLPPELPHEPDHRPPKDRRDLRRHVEDFLDEHSNHSTYRTYADAARRFLRWCRAHGHNPFALTPNELEQYRQWLAERPGTGASPPALSSVRLYYSVACSLLRYWDTHMKLDAPCPAPPVPRHDLSGTPAAPITHTEYQAMFIEACMDNTYGPDYAPGLIITLMVLDGLSPTEIVTATPVDQRWVGEQMPIVLHSRRRTWRHHLCPASTHLMQSYLRDVSPSTDTLLMHKHAARPFTRWEVWHLVRRAGASAEVDLPHGVRPKDLVHTGRNGGPLPERISAKEAKRQLKELLSSTARI